MEQIKKNKFLIIILVLLVIISLFIINFNSNDEGNYNRERDNISLKHYDENKYITVNITYDQISRIYLQDYVYKLMYDRESAYNLLDEKYRNAKFSSFENFNEYIDKFLNFKYKEMIVKKYAVSDKPTFRDFDVYDSGDNLFIFRETGVMQYTVFFDRYTVKM